MSLKFEQDLLLDLKVNVNKIFIETPRLYIPLCIRFEVDMLTVSDSSDESDKADGGAFRLQPAVAVDVVLIVVMHIA